MVRRKTLEGDLARLTEANAAGRAHFDARLAALFDRRVRAELHVYGFELQLLLLARALHQDDAITAAAGAFSVCCICCVCVCFCEYFHPFSHHLSPPKGRGR